MLVLLSPAKRLDYDSPLKTKSYTKPRLLDSSKTLIEDLKKLSVEDIKKLMGVSDDIANLNVKRFNQYDEDFNLDNSRQAILAFNGDVYKDIQTEEYTEEDFEFAQGCLRTLSGLYGVLRPLDLMQPYRLEMHTKFKGAWGKDLYEFWGSKIGEVLKEDLNEGEAILNLASQQYFKSVDPKTIERTRVITPVFKEKKNDGYKIVAIFAKIARGTMSNYIVKNRITDPEDLKNFTERGYKFSEEMSEGDEWIFVRD